MRGMWIPKERMNRFFVKEKQNQLSIWEGLEITLKISNKYVQSTGALEHFERANVRLILVPFNRIAPPMMIQKWTVKKRYWPVVPSVWKLFHPRWSEISVQVSAARGLPGTFIQRFFMHAIFKNIFPWHIWFIFAHLNRWSSFQDILIILVQSSHLFSTTCTKIKFNAYRLHARWESMFVHMHVDNCYHIITSFNRSTIQLLYQSFYHTINPSVMELI